MPFPETDAERYGQDGWSDSEVSVFESLIHVLDTATLPVRTSKESFDKLLDMLSRMPVTVDMPNGTQEVVIVNMMITDPEDPRPHVVIKGRKVFVL